MKNKIQWDKVSNDEVVIELIKLKERIEKMVIAIEPMALINYELQKL